MFGLNNSIHKSYDGTVEGKGRGSTEEGQHMQRGKDTGGEIVEEGRKGAGGEWRMSVWKQECGSSGEYCMCVKVMLSVRAVLGVVA